MEINNKAPPSPPQNAAQLKAVAQSWQAGQLLKAVVIETRQNSVKLNIGNTLVQAPTNRQHPMGETLLLSLVRAGDKPVLRVLPPLLQPPASQPLQESALKVLLPKQTPLTPLLANLALLSQLKAELTSKLPIDISNSIKKLLDNIAHVDQLNDPKTVRRAIANTGLLLEAKLANLAASRTSMAGLAQSSAQSPASVIREDFKGNLLQLLSVLRQQAPMTGGTALPLPISSSTSGTALNPGQVLNPAHTTPSQTPLTAKENLLRLLNRPTNTLTLSTGEEERSTSASRLSHLTASFSRLPPPFFHHMPLLAQKTQPPTLALLQHRNQIIGELIRQIEGTVARVQLSQLASLPQDNNPQPSWIFELPLRHGETVDVVQMRIEKEEAQTEEEQERRWKVTITLDLPKIGTIYATITINGESSSTSFWAENPDTLQLIENNLPLLRDALEKNGVITGELQCQQGSPPQPPSQSRHTLLIDTQV